MSSAKHSDFDKMHYEKLASGDSYIDDELDISASNASERRNKRTTRRLMLATSISWACSLLLVIICVRQRLDRNHRLTYSPLEEAVEYQTKVFELGLGEYTTKYQGDSPSVDTEWNALYDFSPIAVSQAEAKRLANYTAPLSDDQYPIIPGVFHHLHCLNMIRKALDPDRSPSLAPLHGNQSDRAHDHLLGTAHTSHCIDSIRQALQCNADLTTFVYRKNDDGKLHPEARVAHTCTNFDRIWAWADERQLRPGEYDRDLFA